MKKVLLSLAIVAIAFSANAQKEADKTFKFSVGALVGLPMGDIKTTPAWLLVVIFKENMLHQSNWALP
ncbi:MAG: hypothetical protein IPP72_08145 [Chitinophagaceae bacterium]|nr:hypothetical protein [Chitinophagaceae bacterium]